MYTIGQNIWIGFLVYRRYLLIFLLPLLLTPLPVLVPGMPARGAYILLLMAVYWMTDIIPIYVTALIPVVLGPLMGIISSSQLSPTYMKDTNMLFIGGVLVACTIEHRKLHKRIALSILKLVGSDPKMLMLGFMLPTWFLSMWMSNTATTAMMVTIVEAVLENLGEVQLALQKGNSRSTQEVFDVLEVANANVNPESLKENSVSTSKEELQHFQRIATGLSLSIAYASSCGGIATITGTAPNSILYGIVSSRYGTDTGLSFGTWMAYSLPISLFMLVLVWLWLILLYIGPKACCDFKQSEEKKQVINTILDEELKGMGSFTYAEGVCSLLFFMLTMLWVTKDAGQYGWGRLFYRFSSNGKQLITDSQAALFISLLAFTLPALSPIKLFKRGCQRFNGLSIPHDPADEFLLPWSVVQSKFPWGIIFVLGGGYALSEVCEVSGLSRLIGSVVGNQLGALPINLLIYICCLCASLMTEFTSNAATASILLPIMFSVAESLKIHPFRISFPVTVSTSFAYTLPAATPPNSIVFSKGRVSVRQMIKSGFFLNLLGNVVVLTGSVTYASSLFKLDEFPAWANTTATISGV